MNKQQRTELARLKSEINQPKHRLIDILSRIEEISPRQAEMLGKIIGRLEDFQHK